MPVPPAAPGPSRLRRALGAAALAALVAAGTGCQQSVTVRAGGPVAGWPDYGGDAGGTRYSPLTQIDRHNVGALRLAWKIRTGDLEAKPPPPHHATFEATPILVAGLLVLPTPTGQVLALDPETGRVRWRFVSHVHGSDYSEYTSRGVAAWRDAAAPAAAPCATRIFAVTVDSRLFALDAASGKVCPGFGQGGMVSLRKGEGPLQPWDFANSSPPVVAGDLVILGSAMSDNQRVDMPRGIVRAYDARSGALRWFWDPIPRSPADPDYRHWSPEAARRTGAANAWAPISADAARDLVFVPTGSASPDYYGGERPGDDRWADSVVALRASTGRPVWGFQVVHHDLWDYDVPAQPTLTSVRRDGRDVPVVVQATKMGHVFVLHRETGRPVFPVEERPVPRSHVPGEEAWPTQPFPVLPPPLLPERLRPEDAWGLTFWDRGRCRKEIRRLNQAGIFTPPALRPTLEYPGIAGGSNWGGVAVDPKRRLLVLNVSNLAFEMRLIPRRDYARERAAGASPLREFAPQKGTPYGMERGPLLSPLDLPCNPPPWGELIAVGLDTGKVLWRSPLGTVPDAIPFPIPIDMGTPNLGGPLATAGGLVFIGAAMDDTLRAFDSTTGRELWKARLPAGGNATPMTYRLSPEGRQFVVIAAGGHGKLGTRRGDWLMAFSLPGQ